MNLADLRNKLAATYPEAEGMDFSFKSIDSALAICVEGTDVHRSIRGTSESNKDQIDLTYGPSLPEGSSPVDDFFPTITRPQILPQQRHLTVPCRIWGGCLPDGVANWVEDRVDVVRLAARNEGRHPSLQLRGVDPIRRQIKEKHWLIFVHQARSSAYEAFSLDKDEWTNPSNKTKEVLRDSSGRSTRVDFDFADLQGGDEAGEPTGVGQNKIYFGPPGTGKSTLVKRAVGAGHKIRTQFHPEYTHGDFVGSYRPVVGIEKGTANTIETHDGEDGSKPVNYFAFVPGPLTLALEQAFTAEDHVFLLIEEINRGDCAAIFGDVFQLLDRRDDGWSDYGILPKPELAAYFRSRKVPYNADGGDLLYLPPNLSLLATMNTSDQSLHPMDSAFKRRWHWVACHVDYDQLTDYTGKVRPFLQDKKGKWDWIHLLENLNADIVSDTMEDRQVGPWFIKPEKSGAVSFETFVNKCLFYLWHDVFKDEQISSDYSPFRKDGPKTFGDLQKRIRHDGLEAGIKPELLKSYQEEESHSADSSGDSAPAVAVDSELAQAQDDESDSTS